MAVRKAVVEACTLVMSAGKVPSTLGPAVSLLPVLFLVLVLCCLVLGLVFCNLDRNSRFLFTSIR